MTTTNRAMLDSQKSKILIKFFKKKTELKMRCFIYRQELEKTVNISFLIGLAKVISKFSNLATMKKDLIKMVIVCKTLKALFT